VTRARSARRFAWVAVAAAGCSFGGRPSSTDPDADPAAPDADPTAPDADPDDPDAAPAPDSHLVLSEVRTIGSSEFIEIYNPTTAPVALGNYYLADTALYWQLPAVVAETVEVPETFNDFVVRFPAATIGPDEVVVICINPGEFGNAFGFDPAFSVRNPPASSDTVEMRATPFGVDNFVSITNTGELVVLFHWDGASDLVDDVDLFVAGEDPDPGNGLSAKGESDGPDADAAPTAYADDDLTLQDMDADTGGDDLVNRLSYKRVLLEAGHEELGGNGLGGHDETSERTRETWDNRRDPEEYTPATPGVVDL
jgi:hypothetical protein